MFCAGEVGLPSEYWSQNPQSDIWLRRLELMEIHMQSCAAEPSNPGSTD